MKAGAKELSFESKTPLDAVARSDDVVTTFRGKPGTKLVLNEQEKEAFGESIANELFGIWTDRDDMDKIDNYVRDLRKCRIS